MVCPSLSRKTDWTLPREAVLSSTPWRVTVWGAEPALLPGGEGHGARQGHVVEDVELPVVAQGLADVEGEVGAPVGDVHVLDAGGQGGCHGLVNLELLGHGRVQLGLPLGRTAGGQGKEEQKAEGE